MEDGHLEQCRIRGLEKESIDARMRELDRLNLGEAQEAETEAGGDRRRSGDQVRQVSFGVAREVLDLRRDFASSRDGRLSSGTGSLDGNPLRWIKGPRLDWRMRLPRRIGKEHHKKLWEAACPSLRNTPRYQLLCVLAILYGTGLRRGELSRMDLRDWNRDDSTLKVDGHKTGRERVVPVSEGVWRCIEGYLPHRHNILERESLREEPSLLVNRRGRGSRAKTSPE